MKNKNIIGALFALAILFTGCAKTELDPIPFSQLKGDSLATTTTIAQLEAGFMTNIDVYTDTLSKKAGLFTADIIPTDTTNMVINGIVTSADVSGNIYKYIVVQETGLNGQAIKISIDAGSLSGIYPLGQKVSIRCNNLYIGKYAQSPQIGIKYANMTKIKVETITRIDTIHNNSTYVLDTVVYNKNIYRIEPGRIPLPIAMKAIHAYGMPDVTAIKTDTMTIAQIKAAGTSIFNKLVCIKNAFFTGNGAYSGKPIAISAAELIFAPSTNGVGYPQSREIQDGTGSIFVATSEFANFANKKLPSSMYKGNITAIVGWYNDKDVSINSSKIYHQLTLRSLNDLGKGYEGYQVGNN
ncbi:MAG: DUF5689 domain-containing protein [Paludibacter sp.]